MHNDARALPLWPKKTRGSLQTVTFTVTTLQFFPILLRYVDVMGQTEMDLDTVAGGEISMSLTIG